LIDSTAQETNMTTRRQQINNLKNLIRVAEEFRDSGGKLDMNVWGVSKDSTPPSLKEVRGGDCGTTVCLGGRAGLDPYFRRQGLRLDFHKGFPGVCSHFSHVWEGTLNELFGIKPGGQAYLVWFADNEITPTGRISKKRTLNKLIANIKTIALENFGVSL
jgi:hypothetical protein